MSLPTHAQIVSEILAAVKASEPDVETSVGSFVGKLADAFAETLHESSLDTYLRGYIYDIDAKRGADLDDFVRAFGFSRLPAQRAVGQVTFSRTGSSALAVIIPQGTQVASTSTGVTVATVVTSRLIAGDTAITVPAVAVVGGTSGNVSSGTLTIRKTPLDGITSTTNLNSFTGGTDAESDAHLRSRFKATIFRNMAGTEQNFVGVALDNPAVTQANVVGSAKRWSERLEFVSGTATSTVPDAAYVYEDTFIVGASVQTGSIVGENVVYTVDPHNGDDPVQPEITRVAGSDAEDIMPDGVYDVEFDYVPLSSRNDPTLGITNRVDIYVRGENPREANETLIFDSSKVFNNTVGSPMNRTNFQRVATEATPTNGNYFVPFTFVPVMDPSTIDSITILGATGGLPITYLEGTHFWHVEDITARGGSPRSLAGIEIRTAANGSPLINPHDDSPFTVDYIYNGVPSEIESQMVNWRLVGQDLWVHAAKMKRLRLHFVVVLQYGITKDQIEADLVEALSKFIDTVGFNNVLQASDLLQVAGNVDGVDAIRFATDVDDGTHYAIQRVNQSGTVMETYSSGTTPKRAIDVIFGDDESPVLDDVTVIVKAENTWGSV